MTNQLNQIEKIMKDNASIGVYESNPITSDYHEEERETVYFEELMKNDNIELERLRLVTDSYVPFYDVSYCHIIVNGKKCELLDFVYQIPKRGMKKYLVEKCKTQGLFIKDLCNNSRISILR